MRIRRALDQDIPGIHDLLSQVLEIHHAGRPDLFRTGARKYTDEQVREMIRDDARPIFVAVGQDAPAGTILGYAFCEHQSHVADNILNDMETLYIDDLCVSEQARGQHVGRALYDFVLDYARAYGCYNVTLNVWAKNEGARAFYERLGLSVQKLGLEQIL